MPTPRELKARMKALSGRRPAVDLADVARIYAMLEPMAGLLGCGDPPAIEKNDDSRCILPDRTE